MAVFNGHNTKRNYMKKEIPRTELIRGKLPVFSRQTAFSELSDKHSGYRKSMISMAIFSLLINFSGIRITKSEFGIIGGTISNPDIIPLFLFIICCYLTVLFAAYTSCMHSFYGLSTKNYIKRTFFRELGEAKLTEQLFIYLKQNIPNLVDIYIPDSQGDHKTITFKLFFKKYLSEDVQNKIIQTAKTYGFEIICSKKPNNAITAYSGYEDVVDQYFNWTFIPSADDESFIDNYYKPLRLKDISNFIEIRLPLYFSIAAIYSYALQFDSLMKFIS